MLSKPGRGSGAPTADWSHASRALSRIGSRTPLRRAFVSRGLRALLRLSDEMDEEAARVAVSAPSDVLALLSAMESAESIQFSSDDPLALARVRGIRERDRMLRLEGGVLTAEEAARGLRLTRQAVDKRRKAGRLLALPLGRRGFAYPAWQFTRGGTLPGLERVLAAFEERDPWMQAVFLLSPDPRCGGRLPLSLLRIGEVEPVVRAARAYGEQGAS